MWNVYPRICVLTCLSRAGTRSLYFSLARSLFLSLARASVSFTLAFVPLSLGLKRRNPRWDSWWDGRGARVHYRVLRAGAADV